MGSAILAAPGVYAFFALLFVGLLAVGGAPLWEILHAVISLTTIFGIIAVVGLAVTGQIGPALLLLIIMGTIGGFLADTPLYKNHSEAAWIAAGRPDYSIVRDGVDLGAIELADVNSYKDLRQTREPFYYRSPYSCTGDRAYHTCYYQFANSWATIKADNGYWVHELPPKPAPSHSWQHLWISVPILLAIGVLSIVLRPLVRARQERHTEADYARRLRAYHIAIQYDPEAAKTCPPPVREAPQIRPAPTVRRYPIRVRIL
jgi:hypothetical protein